MGENTDQHIRDFLAYDPKTGHITAKVSFGPHKRGDRVGTKKSDGYRTVGIFYKVYMEHHLAWFLQCGHWPKEAIDHINGVRDDNRIANLRAVTHAENCRNRRRMRNNTSGVQGVYFFKRANRWKASIRADGKSIHLGYFESREEAALARLGAERALGYHENHGKSVD